MKDLNVSTTCVLALTVLVILLPLTVYAYKPAIVSRRSMTMSMPQLPNDVVKYSQVPAAGKTFTADKIPRGLLKQHTTKKGTWGIIQVRKGELEYTILEPEKQVFDLKAPAQGIIEPTVLHQVRALTDDLEFVVELYRKPGTGPVDEKREE